MGLTTKEYPTFWFYIPYHSTEIRQAELMLLDENQSPVLEKPILVQLSKTPGIISVKLPSTAKPLELEREYRWFFELVCDSENPSNNHSVHGWIKRVQGSQELNSQLGNSQTQKSYQIYAENGIWYDALTSLIQGMSANPSDSTLSNDWSNFLKSVELEEFIQIPIIDCC